MKDKFIIKLNGGLGNQMFQWALAKMIEEISDMEAYIDMSYFSKNYARPYQLDVFRIKPKILSGFLVKLILNIIWRFRGSLNHKTFLGFTLYSEEQFNFDKRISRIKPNTYIEGFFQSEKYFKSIEDKVREEFKFDPFPDDNNQKIIHQINNAATSISLHVRRGDYVEKQRYQEQYAQCSLEYYQRAVDYIAQRYPNPTLFIFSDDINWVKRKLKLPYESIYVSHNTGLKSHEDMRLMSLCNHNVIANSSFSWWGAWLNNHKDKIVIAPMKWFNDEKINQSDIIPENWVKLDN